MFREEIPVSEVIVEALTQDEEAGDSTSQNEVLVRRDFIDNKRLNPGFVTVMFDRARAERKIRALRAPHLESGETYGQD